MIPEIVYVVVILILVFLVVRLNNQVKGRDVAISFLAEQIQYYRGRLDLLTDKED